MSECTKLAMKEYKRRHDCVARALHWDLLRQNGFHHSNKWYQHEPEAVVEDDHHKILWDFTIQTDRKITARRPDIVVINKDTKSCHIIDVAIPGDARIVTKQEEKIDKYQDLAREIRSLWKVKAKVIPIVIGALGTIPKGLNGYLKEIGVTTRVELLQKSALLGTAGNCWGLLGSYKKFYDCEF